MAMSVHVERTVQIDAPPEVVWKVMTDVEKWPEWTSSVRKVERLGETPFGKGSSARVAARGTPRAVWQVTEYEENRSFTWEAKTANSLAVAGHVIEPDGAGSRVTLSVTISGGLVVALFTPVIAVTARRNVRQEAEGLKLRSEEMVRAT